LTDERPAQPAEAAKAARAQAASDARPDSGMREAKPAEPAPGV
jgi:hypothetical protein